MNNQEIKKQYADSYGVIRQNEVDKALNSARSDTEKLLSEKFHQELKTEKARIKGMLWEMWNKAPTKRKNDATVRLIYRNQIEAIARTLELETLKGE